MSAGKPYVRFTPVQQISNGPTAARSRCADEPSLALMPCVALVPLPLLLTQLTELWLAAAWTRIRRRTTNRPFLHSVTA